MKPLKNARQAVVCVAVLFPSLVAGAQQPALGRFGGHVEDHAGISLAAAEMRVTKEGAEVARMRTDDAGNFQFQAVPDTYRVSVSRDGFEAQQISQSFTTDPARGVYILQSPQVGPRLQRSRVGELASAKPLSFGVLVQGGVGLEDRDGFGFLNLGVRAGKVLTPEVGSGLLRGNFEYGVAVLPFWQSYTPRLQRIKCVTATSCSAPYTVGGTFNGVSIEPIQLRWNFTHGQRLMPWIQGAGGVVWTNHKYPPIGNLNPQDLATNGPGGTTSVWNFTPQFGVGVHYFVKPRRSLDFSANAVHLSSASLGDKNPGVNTSVHFAVGYSWWK